MLGAGRSGPRCRATSSGTYALRSFSILIGIGTGLLSEGAAISLAMFPILFLVVIIQLLYIRRVEVR